MKAILVLFDSLNRRYLSAYNSDNEIVTPNFERLSNKAVKYTNSYIGSMPCIPARRELHTGRYNFLHREWGPIEPFDHSMPEILKNNGIYSHLISDHVHYWEDGGATFHTRYSSFEMVRGQEGDHWKGEVKNPDIPETVLIPRSNDGNEVSSLWRYDWINRKYITKESEFPQTLTFDLGCQFIEKNANQDSWFLQIETFDPHEPFYAPDSYRELYCKQNYEKHFDWPRGKCQQSRLEIEQVRDEYRALVAMCDYNLGRILDLMDKYSLWDDTLLIVGTDHGFLLGEHGYWGKNIMPYYNEIANTPFWLYNPKKPLINQRSDVLVQMIDWAPTILDFFGIEPPIEMLGKSLVSEDVESDLKNRTIIFGTFSGHINVTDGNYIYMKSSLPEFKDEIYNYTLMPLHMNKRFSIEELKTATLVPGFKFSRGVPLLKIKAKEKYPVSDFGDLLFDNHLDYHQMKVIHSNELEQYYKNEIIKHMEFNEAPLELYSRYGLKKK